MHKRNIVCILEVAVRTTLDLPKSLLDEAMKLSHHRTKTGVIISALEGFVRRSKIQRLKKYRGRVDLDIDLATLRERR